MADLQVTPQINPLQSSDRVTFQQWKDALLLREFELVKSKTEKKGRALTRRERAYFENVLWRNSKDTLLARFARLMLSGAPSTSDVALRNHAADIFENAGSRDPSDVISFLEQLD